MSYATVDEALARIGHAGATDANLMARMSDALTAASVAIDNDTGRSFGNETATRTFGAEHLRELHVDDLVSVTTLKVDDDDDGTFETTIAASGYELDTMYGTGWPFDTIRLFDRSWPTGGRRRRRIQIAGVWGWSAVPGPINQACTLLAARIAQRPSTALFGTQSFGDLGAAAIRSKDPDYYHLIGPYQRPMVA